MPGSSAMIRLLMTAHRSDSKLLLVHTEAVSSQSHGQASTSQARRRGQASLLALADRAGVAQQEIGAMSAPCRRRSNGCGAGRAACDPELAFGLARADDSYDQQIAFAPCNISARLKVPSQTPGRLRTAATRARSAPVPASWTSTGSGELIAGVSCVLIGELAEVLHDHFVDPGPTIAARQRRDRRQ